MKEFGTIARELRLQQNKSLRGLAARIGKSPAYVSDIERGRRNPPKDGVIKDWADALGVSPSDLLHSPFSKSSSDDTHRLANMLIERISELTDAERKALWKILR